MTAKRWPLKKPKRKNESISCKYCVFGGVCLLADFVEGGFLSIDGKRHLFAVLAIRSNSKTWHLFATFFYYWFLVIFE